MESLELSRTITVDAPPQTTYRYISEPTYLASWFCDAVEADGDRVRFTWKGADGGENGFVAKITDRVPEKLFRYESLEDEPTVTTFTLHADGDSTRISVTETGITTQATLDEHAAGWDWFLSRLQALPGKTG